jgi:hypothetical protein
MARKLDQLEFCSGSARLVESSDNVPKRCREMLDHVIPLNERHLLRLGQEYITYYQDDRTQIGLQKETPVARPEKSRLIPPSQVLALRRPGGLHHRYTWSAATSTASHLPSSGQDGLLGPISW